MSTETSFEYTETAPSGSLAGSYLWSDPKNWSNGVPTSGDSVTVPYNSAGVTYDDIGSLSVAELTLDSGENENGLEVVDGTLAIGTLATSNGFAEVIADPTGLVTVGSLAAGVNVDLFSYGSGALLVDSSPTDAGTVYYDVYDGGMVEFSSGSPTGVATFDTPQDFGGDEPGTSGGTFAFESPGSVIATPLEQVDELGIG